MSLSPSIRRPLERWVMPLLLAVNLLLMLYYLARNYQFAVHSDSAVMNLLAQEIHDTGQFFPRGWNYANGDLWVWFPHTVIVPLLNWLPNSYGLHALSSALTAALVLLGAWCVGAMLGQSRLARLVTLLVLSGGISVNMAENLYGQAAYGVLFYLACFLAYSGWRLLQAGASARWRWGALFALLMVLVFWSNPQRAAVFYGLPLILAALSQLALSGHAPQPQRRLTRRRVGLLLAVLLAALLAGAALHGHYVKLVGSSGLAPATWLGFDGMLRNTLGTLRGLLSLLGGLPQEGAAVISAAGAWSALRIAAALALLGLLPWALKRALSAPQQPARVFFAVFTLTSAGINLFVALTTSLPDMAAPEASVRYLVPSLMCMLLLLAGMAVDEFRWRRPLHAAALLALLVTGFSALQAYRVDNSPGYYKGSIGAYSPYHQFAAYLEQQGLRYGYASFWNAGRLTLLSEQKVKVRQVSLDNGLPVPVRHLSSDRWYQAEAWRGETFLMFTEAESKATDWPTLERYAGPPSRVLQYRGWEIRVYPHNLAARLPLWNVESSAPLAFPVTAATPHRIGHLVDNDGALQAGPGESGHLQYGPLRSTSAGRYLVSFELETGGAGVGDFGVVDISANHGATVLAAQAIRAQGAQRITLPLKLDGPAGDIEFRVWSNGAGTLKIKRVEMTLQALRAPTTK
jgi:hypothetical protein